MELLEDGNSGWCCCFPQGSSPASGWFTARRFSAPCGNGNRRPSNPQGVGLAPDGSQIGALEHSWGHHIPQGADLGGHLLKTLPQTPGKAVAAKATCTTGPPDCCCRQVQITASSSPMPCWDPWSGGGNAKDKTKVSLPPPCGTEPDLGAEHRGFGEAGGDAGAGRVPLWVCLPPAFPPDADLRQGFGSGGGVLGEVPQHLAPWESTETMGVQKPALRPLGTPGTESASGAGDRQGLSPGEQEDLTAHPGGQMPSPRGSTWAKFGLLALKPAGHVMGMLSVL